MSTNLLSPLPTLHIQTFVNFCNFTKLYLRTLKTYHFLIWQCHSYWNNPNPTVSTRYVSEAVTEKRICFLYCCDVSEMIVCIKKNNNKIKQNKNEQKRSTIFFTAMKPKIRVISSPVKPCSLLAVAYKPWDCTPS